MSFEDTIYYSCAAWACIHPNRASALDHLFCVNGNGYEWQDGELVEVCGLTTTKAGRRLSLRAAINKAFRDRRKSDKFKKKWEAKRRCEEKKNPLDKELDAKLDKMIEDAIATERKLREADPVAYEERKKRLEAEFAETKKRWRADQKWDYRIPTDIKQRVLDIKYNGWYPISEKYSHLLNFPDDIKSDWLDGIIETCNLIIARPPAIREPNYPASQSEHTVTLAKKALEKALALRGNYDPDR